MSLPSFPSSSNILLSQIFQFEAMKRSIFFYLIDLLATSYLQQNQRLRRIRGIGRTDSYMVPSLCKIFKKRYKRLQDNKGADKGN